MSPRPSALGGEAGFETVTGGPKAGFFPAYLEQPTIGGAKGQYTTYIDPHARLRGWKRYPGQSRAAFPTSPTKKELDSARNPVSASARTRLRPIVGKGGDLKFKTKLRFHNLLPEEVGALIWALTWGGDQAARHSLGMGKAYGWGRIAIAVEPIRLRANDSRRTPPSLEEATSAFEEKMETKGIVGSWRNSPQIRALLMLAKPRDPEKVDPHALRYHSLNPQDFQKAKNDRAILPSIVSAPSSIAKHATAVTQQSHASGLRKGMRVFDSASGEDGELLEDEVPGKKTLLVDFSGIEEEVPVSQLKMV